ncbi:MAG: HYR domain-containing protein, partial [Psychroserpens sp.]|uniref:HYR domain-containing protein n=1 Tax=Psychroserpens sp. TaxID=2020870 RepID=UPI003001BC42
MKRFYFQLSVVVFFLLPIYSFSQPDLCDALPVYQAITVDGNTSDFQASIGSDDNGTYYFSADDTYFYIGVNGINLDSDNLHIAFRVPGDGQTNAGVAGMNFPSGVEWTYRIDFYGANDICYFPFNNPFGCQQLGSSWFNHAGFGGNTTSEIRIPRAFLGSLATGDGNVDLGIWANNNVGDFVFDTFPNSNSTGSAPQTWNSYGSVSYPTYESFTDADADGYSTDCDCDDTNAAINPGADEICDGIDNDCDGDIDQADSNLVDNEAPDASCNDITVVLDANGTYDLTVADINAIGSGSSDNCGDVTFSVDRTSFSCDDIGGVSTEITPNYIGTQAQPTHSFGGGFNPNTNEFWYPQWNISTIHKYDNNHSSLGSVNSGQQQMMQIWMDTDSETDYYTANWTDNTITKRSGSSTVWTYNLGTPAGTVTTDADYVYAVLWTSNQIRVLDKTDGTFIRTISLPGNMQSYSGLVYANGYLYIGGYAQNWSSVPNTNAAIHTIDATDGTYISSINTAVLVYSMAFDGETMWISNNSNTIYGYQIAEGSAYDIGIPVVLTVTDSNNNVSTCTASVSVIDNSLPTLTCPANITQNTDVGVCGAEITYAVTTADNCTITIEQTEGLASGEIFPLGLTTNTFIVTDVVGNTATCSFNVTIIDNEDPTISCPTDITVNNDEGRCGAVVNYEVTPADNCASSGASSLSEVLTAVNTDFETIADLIPNRYNFVYDIHSNNNIYNGGPDMYDNGNYLNTNLATGIPYTYNTITTSNAFGTGGQYFTRHLPGLFVMAADINALTQFRITGNLGADGSGSAFGSVQTLTKGATTYTAFIKEVVTPVNDPSVNHMIIVENNPSASHTYSTNTDSDYHVVNGLGSSTRIYYLLYAGRLGSSGFNIPDADHLAIFDAFTDLLDGGIELTQTAGIASGEEFPVGTTTNTFVTTDTSGNTATCSFDVTVLDNEGPVVATDLLPDSTIISGTDQALITGWLPANLQNEANLLFTKTVDGSTASTFHSLCDGIPNTLFVARTTDGRIFGGYNEGVWNGSQQGYVNNLTNNFLFSVTNQTKHTQGGQYGGTGSYSIYNRSDYGPTFGGGHDLVIYNNLTNGYSNLGHSYECVNGTYGSTDCRDNLAGSYNGWQIEEIEVWELSSTGNQAGNGVLDIIAQCEVTSLETLLANDNCSGEIQGVSDANLPITYQGTTVITWTFNDGNGNITTETQNVIIEDTEGPDAICQDVTLQLDANGQATLTAEQVNNGSTDNCAIASLSVSPSSFSCNNINQVTTDQNALNFDGVNDYVDFGNIAGANFGTGNFTIELWVKTNQATSYPAALISKRAVCNSDNFWNIRMQSNGKFYIEFLDPLIGNHQTTSASAINDNTWHHIAVKKDGSTVSLFLDGALDNSGIANTSINLSNTYPVQIGRDACSDQPWGEYYQGSMDEVRIWNTARLNADIASDYNKTIDGSATGLVAYYNMTENTGTNVLNDISYNANSGTLTNMDPLTDFVTGQTFNGTSSINTVTLTVTDESGNTATCIANVTVEDNIDPVINNTPTNISVNNNSGICGAEITWIDPTVSDNCTGSTLTIASSPTTDLINGSVFPVGITTVTYTASDASDNDAMATSFTITVTDTEIPVINGTPANIVVENSSGSCEAAATWTAATVSDNCPNATIDSNYQSGDTFPVGTTTVTYTAEDAAGNEAAVASFTVTVSDTEAPTITCPGNITVNNTTGTCSAVVNFDVTATDNCDGYGPLNVLLAAAESVASLTDVQTKLVATGQFNSVDIFDTQLGTPTLAELQNYDVVFVWTDFGPDNYIALGDNLAAYIDGGGAVVDAVFDIGALNIQGAFNTDTYRVLSPTGQEGFNGIRTLGTVLLPAHPIMQGVTAFDGGTASLRGTSNSITAGSYDIALYDNNQKFIIAKENVGPAQARRVSLNFYPPSSSIHSSYWDTSTDGTLIMTNALNWAGNDVVQTAGITSGSEFPVGTTTNTFVVTDAAGNTDSCTFTVTVEDNEAPTISCPTNISLNATSASGAVVNYTEPVGADNCAATTTLLSGPASGATFPIGNTVVSYQ